MSGRCQSLSFTADSTKLLTYGGTVPEIYISLNPNNLAVLKFQTREKCMCGMLGSANVCTDLLTKVVSGA